MVFPPESLMNPLTSSEILTHPTKPYRKFYHSPHIWRKFDPFPPLPPKMLPISPLLRKPQPIPPNSTDICYKSIPLPQSVYQSHPLLKKIWPFLPTSAWWFLSSPAWDVFWHIFLIAYLPLAVKPQTTITIVAMTVMNVLLELKSSKPNVSSSLNSQANTWKHWWKTFVCFTKHLSTFKLNAVTLWISTDS